MKVKELSNETVDNIKLKRKQTSTLNLILPTLALNELKEFFNTDICTYPSFTAFLLASAQKEMRFLQLQHNVDDLGNKIIKLTPNQKQYLTKRYLHELIETVKKNE